MFTMDEFKKALDAYKLETSPKGKEEFTEIRKNPIFFNDIRTSDAVNKQVKHFIDIISNMNRDNYINRYVLQTFIQDFCKFLDKDFLFFITDSSFFDIKKKIKEFTGAIYEINKNYTQIVGLFTLDHLLQDYSVLLKFTSSEQYTTLQDDDATIEAEDGLWGGNKLW
tara:strand:- start:1127 stop:1627 length:501 start_codon:yes stop_codon:yes gene_type:complete